MDSIHATKDWISSSLAQYSINKQSFPFSLSPTQKKAGQIACGVGAAVTVSLVLMSIYAHQTWQKQRKPLPNDSQLSLIGGKYFVRNSDGKKTEYFVVNPNCQSQRAMILIHGSAGTGWLWANWERNEIDQILHKYNIKLICPSLPGHGASEPLASNNNDNIEDPIVGINIIASDLTQLLENENINEIYCMGISYGSEIAFYLAKQLLLNNNSTTNSKITVKGISSLCGAAWATKTFDPTVGRELPLLWRLLVPLFYSKITLIPSVLWLFAPFMKNSNENLEAMKKQFLNSETTKELISKTGGDSNIVNNLCKDLLRTSEYFFHGLIIPTLYFTNGSHDFITDYSSFNQYHGDIKIHFHYGDNDTDVSIQARNYTIKQIKYSKYFEFEGTHMHVPLKQAIQSMLETETQT